MLELNNATEIYEFKEKDRVPSYRYYKGSKIISKTGGVFSRKRNALECRDTAPYGWKWHKIIDNFLVEADGPYDAQLVVWLPYD